MNTYLKVTQKVKVNGGQYRLMDKYVLVGGFRRYEAMKDMLNERSHLTVLCDGFLIGVQFGQIVRPKKESV